MKEYQINDRKWAVGNFTIRKTANGETRFDGRYLVLKRSTSGRWAIIRPVDDIATVNADAVGRDYHVTRKAAAESAMNILAKWATE